MSRSLTVTGSGTPGEYPGSLIAAYGGFRLVPEHRSSIFQDDAGATPATAEADVVGLIRDQGASGYNFSQSVAGTKPVIATIGSKGRFGIKCVTSDILDGTVASRGIINAATGITLFGVLKTFDAFGTAGRFYSQMSDSGNTFISGYLETDGKLSFQTRRDSADGLTTMSSALALEAATAYVFILSVVYATGRMRIGYAKAGDSLTIAESTAGWVAGATSEAASSSANPTVLGGGGTFFNTGILGELNLVRAGFSTAEESTYGAYAQTLYGI